MWKLSVDAGCNLPEPRRHAGHRGCIFCDPASFSPSRRLRPRSIAEQIDEGMRRLSAATSRGAVRGLLPAGHQHLRAVDRLRQPYEEALAHPQVVGLAVGTRPDCVGDDVLDLLAELAARTWVSIEYGLQTIHDRTLDWLNRGHRLRRLPRRRRAEPTAGT